MDIMSGDLAWLLMAMISAGALAGVTAGLFGIGGGFVVVPALLYIFERYDVEASVAVHLAIGTSLATIISTSIRATLSHAKRGAVDFTVLKEWSLWLILGVVLGLVFASGAPANLLVAIFGGGVLVLSVHFLFPRWLGDKRLSNTMPRGASKACLATVLGGMSALLGIGGGTIAVLTMTLSGRPIHQAVGTASGFGALIAIPGALGFMLIGMNVSGLPAASFGYVNVMGWLGVSLVSLLTAPLGARLAHSLDPLLLKRAFGLYLLITGLIMLNKSVVY